MIKKNSIKILEQTKPIKGFLTSGIHAGIKNGDLNLDMGLIYCDKTVASAGVFTRNVTKAAPVTVSKSNLEKDTAKAILINSGNANACTGKQGFNDALECVKLIASHLDISEKEVLVSSTGIIGVPLPMDVIKPGIKNLVSNLDEQNIANLSKSIMTTDTFEKSITVQFDLHGKIGHVTGVAKGSGMIHPNMATMLGFLLTDVTISSQLLSESLQESTGKSFNMISVDGDTSTNDMVLALASGAEGAPSIETANDLKIFKEALLLASIELSKLIAKDGEGATKLLEMTITGAPSQSDASLAAKAVISSSLVKSAFFGNDANWGRIICAMGYSGAQFDPDKVSLRIESQNGSLHLMSEGSPIVFDESHALHVLSTESVSIIADLDQGDHQATAWGCDLTYEYVKINGEYRS